MDKIHVLLKVLQLFTSFVVVVELKVSVVILLPDDAISHAFIMKFQLQYCSGCLCLTRQSLLAGKKGADTRQNLESGAPWRQNDP